MNEFWAAIAGAVVGAPGLGLTMVYGRETRGSDLRELERAAPEFVAG